MMDNLEIRQVITIKDLKRFVRFPFNLYKGNAFWVPPFISDEIRTLCKDINPVFEYCEAEYWILYKDGNPAGRIAGIINHHETERWNKHVARFGWFDFINDEEVSSLLIETVKQWAIGKGMTALQGPMGFTNMDAEGMLMEGYEEMSSPSAIYNFPYYADHMVKLGFTKSADMVQYEMGVPNEVPAKVERLKHLVVEKYGLRLLKPANVRELQPYIGKMFLLYNESFHDIYGFTALTEKQIKYYIDKYMRLIRPELISLVIDSNDDVVGFGISMPSLARAMQKARGKLLPFGFFHLQKALNHNDVVQLYLVGVRPDYQGKGLLALVYQELHATFIKCGFKLARTLPQLEDNLRAVSIWKNYDNSRVNIRRRIWTRDI